MIDINTSSNNRALFCQYSTRKLINFTVDCVNFHHRLYIQHSIFFKLVCDNLIIKVSRSQGNWSFYSNLKVFTINNSSQYQNRHWESTFSLYQHNHYVYWQLAIIWTSPKTFSFLNFTTCQIDLISPHILMSL